VPSDRFEFAKYYVRLFSPIFLCSVLPRLGDRILTLVFFSSPSGELPNAKRVCLHANIDTHDASTDTTITDDAVLVLEQATLGDNPVALQELFGASGLQFSADFLNDRYAKYKMSLEGAPSCMYMNLSVTTKATAKDIDKYRPRDRVLVRESPLAYSTVVAPFIDARPTKETKWLINILEGTAEQDRMLYSDPDPVSGFVLLPVRSIDAWCVSFRSVDFIGCGLLSTGHEVGPGEHEAAVRSGHCS
jgi:hypothetical protein